MRKGELRVALNTSKRDNNIFIDPLTNTTLSYKNPISGDLNQVFTNKLTGEQAQMELTNIIKGLETGVLTIFKGEIEGYTKTVPPPTGYVMDITQEELTAWNMFVQNSMLQAAR